MIPLNIARDMDARGFVTVSRAALHVGVSRAAIYNAIEDGRLKPHRRGPHVFVKLSDVEFYYNEPGATRKKGSGRAAQRSQEARDGK